MALIPALNFQKRFVEGVESGIKWHTIRAMRQRPFRVGDRLYLFTGQRTRYCRRLGETDCIKVDGIRIYSDERIVLVNGLPFDPVMVEWLALNDGFKDIDSFFEFFGARYNFDFGGQIIWWDPEKIER